VTTYVGKQPGDKRLRRFLVGPKECEITGIAETPDGRTLFVNIQHPGESTPPNFATAAFGSHWPDGGTSRPRSATIVITRNDGGEAVAEVTTRCRHRSSGTWLCTTKKHVWRIEDGWPVELSEFYDLDQFTPF
jgi:hypothetical protein